MLTPSCAHSDVPQSAKRAKAMRKSVISLFNFFITQKQFENKIEKKAERYARWTIMNTASFVHSLHALENGELEKSVFSQALTGSKTAILRLSKERMEPHVTGPRNALLSASLTGAPNEYALLAAQVSGEIKAILEASLQNNRL